MLKCSRLEMTWYHIQFEPGDATRYDFLVSLDHDEFLIVPYVSESNFRMPQKINKFVLIDVINNYETKKQSFEDASNALSDNPTVNMHTNIQVARAIYKAFRLELIES